MPRINTLCVSAIVDDDRTNWSVYLFAVSQSPRGKWE